MRLTQAILDACWDFEDPAGSEQRFRAAIALGIDDWAMRAEFQTQLARTLGLQRLFDQGHRVLDQVDQQAAEAHTPTVQTRIALERGRLLNSSGNPEQSRGHFETAWDIAIGHGLDGLAVDAAHMLAIVAEDDDAFRWHERAMALCEQSQDPVARRWRASLLNNAGWTAFSANKLEDALDHFEQALEARIERGTPREIQIALWCVARAFRALDRVHEALNLQQLLAAGPASDDSYVHEELAECLLAMQRPDEAAASASRAIQLIVAHQQPKRIARLRELASAK